MSHFTVLVIDTKGVELEKHLAPFQENNCGDCPKEFLAFKDIQAESRKEYRTGTCQEFYCESHSSAGLEMSEELFAKIKGLPVGSKVELTINKDDIDRMQYLQLNKKYRANVNYGKPDAEVQWIKVVNVVRTTHPDRDVVFTGTVIVETIEAPKKVKLNERYKTFEEFMRDWHGHKEKDPIKKKYGYWHNPNSKWDWWVIGGRWPGKLKIKEEHKEVAGNLNFSYGWPEKEKLAVMSQRVADTALNGEVDWDAYHNGEDFDKACRQWEMIVDGDKPKTTEEKEFIDYPLRYTKEFYLEKYGDKITYAKAQCSFTTHAVLKDGEWFEKGSMGWFGCSSATPKEESQFELSYFDSFIKNLPDNAKLTVVDCHI